MPPLHVRYAQEFAHLSLGLALLHPCSETRLHPGVCGYFDEEGDFKTIVDIPKIKTEVSVTPDEMEFTSLDSKVELPEPTTMQWEPKVSSKVTVDKDSGEARFALIGWVDWCSAQLGGIPKLFSKFTFNKDDDFGAVLCAEAPVHLDYFPDDVPFYRWMKRNARKIISEYGELMENGVHLWIITKIYHTSKCSIACWSGSQQTISLGLEAEIPDEVNVKPEGSNVKVQASGPGWAHYGVKCTGNGTAVGGDGSDFVLFVAGIRFTVNESVLGKVCNARVTIADLQPLDSFTVVQGDRDWTIHAGPTENKWDWAMGSWGIKWRSGSALSPPSVNKFIIS
jgi:hypothetical protein